MPTFNPSPLTVAADKVLALINAEEWTLTGQSRLAFEARRVYFLPEYKPDDPDLHVDMLIGEDSDTELVDRGGTVEREFMLAIGVQQVLDDRTNLQPIDELLGFVQALKDFFPYEREFIDDGGTQKIRCTDSKIPIVYSPEELDKNSRFFSVLHLTFKGWF